MAGIDKTCMTSYKDYKSLLDWSFGKKVVFTYNKKTHVELVRDYIYCYFTEEDFDNVTEIPVMNTPTWLDKYLLENCPNQTVLDRLDDVYPKNYLESIDLNSIPEVFKLKNNIIVKRSKRTKVPVLFNKGIKSHSCWLVQCNGVDFDYSDELKAWVYRESHFPSRTNTMYVKTVKSLVRQLRSMYLPKGLEFTLLGKYTGECYTVKVK